MKILKFGGKSLAPGTALEHAVQIIAEATLKDRIFVVVSAIADSTDRLQEIYDIASSRYAYESHVADFWKLQRSAGPQVNFEDLEKELEATVAYLHVGNKSLEIQDQLLSIGERASARIVSNLLNNTSINSKYIDAREIIKVKPNGSYNTVNGNRSAQLTSNFFKDIEDTVVPVITGFIASTEDDKTVTLGRNGTNLTATLVANYLNAEEVQNWTDIDGIYSANPKYVSNASKIDVLSFKEAHELANFGANVLHPKTINPLIEKEIPLKILNSFDPEKSGTIINKEGAGHGIKAVSVIENLALITIEGKGLNGKIGIDYRIFKILDALDISVRLISQASSERGIGFVIDKEEAGKAVQALEEEFEYDIKNDIISSITANVDTSIIAIVGRHNYALEKAIHGLRRNKIWLYLISNSISGEHISLVVNNKNLKKAVNVVYNQVFGVIKTINLFALGKGTVGTSFINQILHTSEEVSIRRGLKINVIGIADSKKYLFDVHGVKKDWRTLLHDSPNATDIQQIIHVLKESGLENIVIADNTASQEITDAYKDILEAGFDLVVSNKKANSGPYSYYEEIRNTLKKKSRFFFYETNVGAGLPIIDTLKHLYDSVDRVTKIRGVFSGSLSYIFNHFSERKDSFYDILLEARDKGFTEPDPREDLNGLDVARKLIILAREIGYRVELGDIKLENLIPESIRDITALDDFLSKKEEINEHYARLKEELNEDEVLRYIGELNTDTLSLKVELQKFKKESPLGGIKNADAIFEIFTEGYGAQPIIVQGAGAGGEVTARGVYTDILKVGRSI